MEPGSLDHRRLWLLFAAALVLRLAYLWLSRGEGPPKSDAYYFTLFARNLLERHEFVEIGARAYRPPGYPWLIAAVYSVFGYNDGVLRVVLAALGSATCVMVVLWSRYLTPGRAAWLAGWFTALYPPLIRYPQTLLSEPLYLFLLALGNWLLFVALSQRRLGLHAATGLVFGLCALTRESGLLLPLVVGLWYIAARPVLRPRLLPAWGVMTVVCGLTVLPWTIRNYVVLGTFVPITTNAGTNFYMGNNPDATGDYLWRMPPGVEWANGANEVEASREGLRAGWSYVRANPGRTVELWARKVGILLRPPAVRGPAGGAAAMAMRAAWFTAYLYCWLAGLYGLWLTCKDWRFTLLPVLLMFVPLLPYIITYAGSRYRLSLEAYLVFAGALGTDLILRRLGGGSPVPDLGAKLQGPSEHSAALNA